MSRKSAPTTLAEGIVHPGSEVGTALGFTADRFDGWLWVKDGAVYVSAIMAKQPGAGHFREVVNAIWGTGYTVKVPTPLRQMEAILRRWNFRRTIESSEQMGAVETWVMEADNPKRMAR